MMRASSSFVFLAAATAMSTLAACTITASDGGSDDGDDGLVGACVSSNESDVGRCDVDCDTAVLGEDDVYECTVSCDATTDCSGSRICAELTDGTGACLEDCAADGACRDTDDTCDVDLLVCLPGDGVDTDDTCIVETVTDAASCDADCDTILEGETAFKCTVGCDPGAQDCGDEDLYCLTLDDGTGACVEDCAGGATCSDAGDHCEPSREVCLPGAEVPDGLCDPLNVSDPSTCDVDCDTYFEGTDGVYQCTISCDPSVQECGDGFYCATLSDDSGSICAFDCADGLVCPTDSVCDEVTQVCVPDTVSP